MMKKLSFQQLLWAGIILGCLELFWNIFMPQLPIYWVPSYHPAIAIPLNAAIHIILTAAPVILFGLLIRTFKKLTFFAPFAVGGYIFYIGLISWAKLWMLYDDESYFLDFSITMYIWAAVVFTGAVCWNIILRKATRNRRSLAWPATITVSALISVAAVILRWPMVAGIYLRLISGILILSHGIIWFITRYWRPSLPAMGKYVLIATSLVLAGQTIWFVNDPPPKIPNIIMVLWDAARADRMSIYGYEEETTPFLESLDQDMLLFENAHSSANYTFASHASIFTGRAPTEHQCWFGGPNVEKFRSFPILAEDMKKKG